MRGRNESCGKEMLCYEQVKKALLQNDFKFIKLEFEANVNGGEECDECDEGTVTCETCGGIGEVNIYDENGNDTDQQEDCPDCGGEGRVTCTSCNGHWEGSQGNEYLDDFQERFKKNLPKGFKSSYIDTYNDTSVNTEVTMTFSVEFLEMSEDIIKAFVKTCDGFGGWNSNNAGFHISLLQSSRYSSRSSNMRALPEKKINNFLRSMDKIIDAMFLLSTGDGKNTRGTYYRQPEASMGTKYSAIFTHNNTCIEYRIFDPCYKNPERFLKFLNVIVRTLKFYSTKHYLIEKNWFRRDLDVNFEGNTKVENMMKNKLWKQILFKKLTYLYSDKSKLKTIEDCLDKNMISDKTALLQLSK